MFAKRFKAKGRVRPDVFGIGDMDASARILRQASSFRLKADDPENNLGRDQTGIVSFAAVSVVGRGVMCGWRSFRILGSTGTLEDQQTDPHSRHGSIYAARVGSPNFVNLIVRRGISVEGRLLPPEFGYQTKESGRVTAMPSDEAMSAIMKFDNLYFGGTPSQADDTINRMLENSFTLERKAHEIALDDPANRLQ